VAFDFLGYGGSDKPAGHPYTWAGLEDDPQALVAGLDLGAVVPVAHDASGPPAINWALAHPERVAALALLNTFYDAAPTLRFPELIGLFAEPAFADLAAAVASDPARLGWLLDFQGRQFARGVPPARRERFQQTLLPIIGDQFAATPSVLPAFTALTRAARHGGGGQTAPPRAGRLPPPGAPHLGRGRPVPEPRGRRAAARALPDGRAHRAARGPLAADRRTGGGRPGPPRPPGRCAARRAWRRERGGGVTRRCFLSR
jgi:pimeloyl-ACP methyl ester carboxylesterase